MQRFMRIFHLTYVCVIVGIAEFYRLYPVQNQMSAMGFWLIASVQTPSGVWCLFDLISQV